MSKDPAQYRDREKKPLPCVRAKTKYYFYPPLRGLAQLAKYPQTSKVDFDPISPFDIYLILHELQKFKITLNRRHYMK